MKKAPQPLDDAPRLVVAVPSLQPEFALYNTATGELKRVYGGNVCENSVYTAGIMPKAFRLAAEDESYHNELILSPLPAEIEETVLSESPECKLVITGYKLLEIQAPAQQPECRVIETPYARTKRLEAEAKAHAKQAAKARANGCIPLQLEINYQPSTRQSA